MRTVFNFSNENLASFSKIYDFKGSRVLSVGGSGDQYFTAILNGAKEVTLFDNDPLFFHFFVAKFCAIQNMSYSEFYDLFITQDAFFSDIFEVIESYLPEERKDEVAESRYSIRPEYGWNDRQRLVKARTIPYLNPIGYQKLQHKLIGRDLPKVYFENITNLQKVLGNSPYDIMLTSNIFGWLPTGFTEKNFFELLQSFNCKTFQATYAYQLPFQRDSTFGRQCKETRVKGWLWDDHQTDYVYTYKKTKKGTTYGKSI